MRIINDIMSSIRKRVYPMHRLRKSACFQTIMPFFDIRISRRLYRVNWRVQLRLMRHLSWILNSRILDPEMVSLFVTISALAKPKILWDVGANIGYYSWLMLSKDPNMCVVLLEPDPENAMLIRETIRRASLQSAKLFDVAASDRDGEATFLLDSISSATGTLETTRPSFTRTHYGIKNREISVKTITLDTLYHQGAPDLIKIDTEGAEERVLDGARMTITTRQPILIFECFRNASAKILPWLSDMGYLFFDIDRITCISENTTNFLCLPPHLNNVASKLIEVWKQEFDYIMRE